MSTMPAGFSFDADKHEYRLGTTIVPGCTSLLVGGGLVSFDFVSRDQLERKSELGRESHRACHLHNINSLGKYDERIKKRLHAWITFKENCKSFVLISSEYQCVATFNGMHYGMKADVNARIDGDDTVIELKIGHPMPHVGVQLAGYAAGLPHPRYTAPLARFLARKRIAVELQENGLPKVHLYNERSDLDVFLSLLHTVSWKRRFDKIYKEKP